MNKTELRALIRRTRIEAKLSVRKAAELYGCTAGYWNQVEIDKKAASPSVLCRMAKAVGLNCLYQESFTVLGKTGA